MVGTSIVRPFRYLTQLRNSSNPETPRNGTSRAPSPTFCSQVLLPQNRFALCGLHHVQEESISGAGLVLRFLSCKRRKFVFLLFPSAPLSRLAPIEALPQAPLWALPPDPHNGFHPLTLTRGVPLDFLLASLGVVFYFELVFPLNYAEICAILKKIHNRG